ncbi:MAG: hypothetical protein GY694_20305 [Gammaproteobacteria bacterium]|nr:hypothetical protein [Gammaproteobacteria bacterium]
MQISNPVISQYISGTLNRSQQSDQLPVKPGVRLDSEFNKDLKQPLAQEESNSQTQLIEEANAPQTAQALATGNQSLNQENQSNSLLVQKKLFESPEILLRGESQGERGSTNNFPYGNRRSFEGLSGSSLVIQKYLNNESPAQVNNSQKILDTFI